MERRNHALWIAPLLALVGLLSYYTLFVNWPFMRDTALVNLAIVAVAAAVGAYGLVRAFRRGGWRIAGGLVSFAVSAGVAALLFFYVFRLSYGLPDPELGLALGAEIPAVQLVALDGSPVALDAHSEGPMLLVFYRGHW